MTRVKSIFISFLPLYATVVTAYGLYRMLSRGLDGGWLGVTWSALVIALLFVRVFSTDMARTPRNLPWTTLFVGLGVVITIVSYILDFAPLSAVPLALMNLFFWYAYVYWYSRFGGRDSTVLKVGQQMPTLYLEDEHAQPVSTQNFQGKPVIYLFYRGNWCPLCMTQIKEIAEQYQALAQRGAETVLISPQPHKLTRALAQKYEVPFHFWVDKKNQVAQQLGIFAKNGLPAGLEVMGYDSDTVMPTLIITDTKNKIIFADLTNNYRVRPEPETFLKVLDQAQVAV